MHTMTQSLTVSALALLAFSLPAAAQDYKVTGQFGWFGVGKAVELEKDHVIWVGEFSPQPMISTLARNKATQMATASSWGRAHPPTKRS